MSFVLCFCKTQDRIKIEERQIKMNNSNLFIEKKCLGNLILKKESLGCFKNKSRASGCINRKAVPWFLLLQTISFGQQAGTRSKEKIHLIYARIMHRQRTNTRIICSMCKCRRKETACIVCLGLCEVCHDTLLPEV